MRKLLRQSWVPVKLFKRKSFYVVTSITICPAIYANATATIGHVHSPAPVADAAPAMAVTPGLQLAASYYLILVILGRLLMRF
jgi:hypothetical protein